MHASDVIFVLQINYILVVALISKCLPPGIISDKICSTGSTNCSQRFGLAFDRPSSGQINKTRKTQKLKI